MGERKKKVEIIYFYSGLYESKKSLLPVVKKLRRERKDINVRLVDIDDPENTELTELYNVNSVPLVIFLTPKGTIASRKSISLSDEDIINSIVDQVIKGDLPKPCVNELKEMILNSLKSIPKRNELTELIIDQIESDVLEADSENEVYEVINFHISIINHTIRDLEEFKKVLQAHVKRDQVFII
ncbi:MAG: thioredoxin domain-containing protein [Candidatus Bathyarchaeia archaeon]|nr:hypothetical protein [Candidatus Bathyarchaeota archaeon]